MIRPLIVGRDITKWRIKPADRFMLLTQIGIEIRKYPAVFAHLRKWKEKLEVRCDRGNHWWELRPCDYYQQFGNPKIVYQEIATYQGFALDRSGSLLNNKVFMIPTADHYLLGILNSSCAWQYLSMKCSKMVGGAL
ncbi:MAG: class I SAM-dependent DNA methyltransferase, partial [Acidobacteriota bacterium]|nr:class I SAM-dependent DNA methyltransferase [Acidobacteriota bacterium]